MAHQKYFDTNEFLERYPFISKSKLYNLVRCNAIPHRKIGGTILFIQEELENYFNALPGVNLEKVKRYQFSK
jgi:hypothetical protein